MIIDIRESIDKITTLNENVIIKEEWYHGTPDGREVINSGGFENRTAVAKYIIDVKGYEDHMNKLHAARQVDMKLYHELLDQISKFEGVFKYNKPIFLSDNYQVAKTYADPHRAFDYQEAEQNIFTVDVQSNKIAKIYAMGDRFRFIPEQKVKSGFVNSGIDEKTVDDTIAKFNFMTKKNTGISTDNIAAIGSFLGFDIVDVIGVLDSYHGGSTKSTVRIVLNPAIAKINS